MAYKLDKHGQQVKDDLDAVEQKTIYPDASTKEKGLMTNEHVKRLDKCESDIAKGGEALTEFEIMMICR